MVYYKFGKVHKIFEKDEIYFVNLKKPLRKVETIKIPQDCYDKINRAIIIEKEMPIIKYLGRFMNRGMRKDLIFYVKHDEELYFRGMVVVAVSWLILSAIFGVFSFFAIKSGYFEGCILLGITTLLGVGFSAVKMYLHIRKDNIEIKEILSGKM